MSLFKRAVKTASYLRMALAGPPGSGKTMSALELATGLTGVFDKNGRAADGAIAVIDSEHGSARKYGDRYNFDVLELDSFHPNDYVDAIKDAVTAGYKVLIIDSLSHAWFGKNGALEQVDKASARNDGKVGNKFSSGWNAVTPMQNALIDSIIRSDVHIIATMRTKNEYVMETDRNGKSVPRKVGLKPIQRDDVDYEFDIYGVLDRDNNLSVEKTRCPALTDMILSKPTRKLAETLLEWLSGVEPVKAAPMATDVQRKDMAAYLKTIFGTDNKASKAHFVKHTGASDSKTITQEAMAEYLQRLDLECEIRELFKCKYGVQANEALTAAVVEDTGATSLDDLSLTDLGLFQEGQLEGVTV